MTLSLTTDLQQREGSILDFLVGGFLLGKESLDSLCYNLIHSLTDESGSQGMILALAAAVEQKVNDKISDY